jgi:hypothetical protein
LLSHRSRPSSSGSARFPVLLAAFCSASANGVRQLSIWSV